MASLWPDSINENIPAQSDSARPGGVGRWLVVLWHGGGAGRFRVADADVSGLRRLVCT